MLTGLKDTNDNIVSMTLRALSDFVNILGGEAVVGSQGSKLFHDRQPDVCIVFLPFRSLYNFELLFYGTFPSFLITIDFEFLCFNLLLYLLYKTM